MEKLFEALVTIDNKKYNFQISSSTEKMGYGASFSRIEEEIRKYFFQGYDDNKNSRSKKTNFEVKFNTDHIVKHKHLKTIFKQAYNYGYQKYDNDKRREYKIDLEIDDPILQSKVKLLTDKIYNDGLSDGKKNLKQKTKIEIPEDLYFINDINKFLIKIYKDGYEEGKSFLNDKYVFNLPKIYDQDLEDRIKIDINAAYFQGLHDFDDRKEKKYFFKINYIEDDLLKKQINELIERAYNDGYDSTEKNQKEVLEKNKKESILKNNEQKELFDLIKKYGELKENKFTSILYNYTIQQDELKIKDEYDFTNIKTDNYNLYNQIKKIVNESYFKGKQDAINGLEKQFFIFKMPFAAKDDLLKNQISNLVNKAYSDGYKKIIDEISNNLSKQINKNPEQKRLEELLSKYYVYYKKITNLPDRYVNKKQFIVEVPSES